MTTFDPSMAITIQLGNSDNKLKQEEWHNFVTEVKKAVDSLAASIYFFGFPSSWEKWQNVAWVVRFDDEVVKNACIARLKSVREKYFQDSIAWSEGITQFI